MKTLIRLFQFVRPYWLLTCLDIVLIIGLSSFRMGPAWFAKLIIDNAVPQHSSSLLALYLVGLVGTSLMTNGLNAGETYLEQFVGNRVIFDLRNFLYRHLQSQSMSFYDSNQTGQLMSRVTNDVSQIQFFVTQGVARLVNTRRDGRPQPRDPDPASIPFLTLLTLLVAPPTLLLSEEAETIMPLFRKASGAWPT